MYLSSDIHIVIVHNIVSEIYPKMEVDVVWIDRLETYLCIIHNIQGVAEKMLHALDE